MPSFLWCSLLVCFPLLLSLPGCSGSSDDPTDHSQESNETPPTGAVDGLTMTIQTYNKREGNYDSANIIKNPDEAEVKKQFESLNWTDPDLRPSLKFVRLKAGKIDSMLVVRRNQETAEGNIQAEWISSDKRELIAPKIDSKETALNLILMFQGEKPGMENVVQWSPLN